MQVIIASRNYQVTGATEQLDAFIRDVFRGHLVREAASINGIQLTLVEPAQPEEN